MPDESCRICGGILENCSSCSECRKATQRICRSCNSKTKEQFHGDCLYLETSQAKSEMSMTLTQKQVRNKKSRQNAETHSLRNAFLVFGVVGFFALGFATAQYYDLFQNQTGQAQAMRTNTPPISSNQNNIVEGLYENCIANGNGQSMIVLCPTTYGYAYKAVVSIPHDLASHLSSEVFSIRGLSLSENSDGSVGIQYQKNFYITSFFST